MMEHMTPELGPGRYLGETRDHQVVADLVVTETLHRLPARLPLHTHTTPYFCLVLSGAFDERVGAKLCEARSGDLLFHSAGETHTDEIRAEGTKLVNIALGGTWLGLQGEIDRCRRPRPGRQSAAAARVAGRIARELAAHDPISGLAIEGLVHRLLAEADHSPASLRDGPPRWLPVTLEFIRSHFRSCFDHEALARVAGVHATHLSRAFHAHMGCTVTGYVHRLRIEWARERVERNEVPLADVALDAGFADQAHFSRVFRRETGSTPSEYRRRSVVRRDSLRLRAPR
jgi:AraC family transcriptional regulator